MKTYKTSFGMIGLDMPELDTMQFGRKRRSYIKLAFDTNPDAVLEVDTAGQPQLEVDTDLQQLLKIGYLEIFVIQMHPIHDYYATYVTRGKPHVKVELN